MKNRKFIYSKITWLLLVLFFIINVSCERDISEDAEFALYPANGEVYIDGFSGGLDYFPYADSYQEAFSVDTETKYSGASSMRFDIPNVGDPNGSYAGAIFRTSGARNLSGYDALTFWAKASESATINSLGFGQDFGENKFEVALSEPVQLTTNWRKYIIPIPDPSKLIQETGMFWYAAAPKNNTDAFTFWVDELQFEKTGTIAQPQPGMLNGEDVEEQAFSGSTINLVERGLTQTFNLASGLNLTVNAAASYFTFNSTDNDVARVSELGIVSIVGEGTATITATLGGVKAQGSLIIETIGEFNFAPIPTLDPSQVISIFSDVYTNVPVDFYNGFWEPFQTTLSPDFVLQGDNILNYTNFNFVGTQFSNPTVDATDKPNLHINMFIPGEIDPRLDFLITLVDFGADGVDGGDDDSRQQVFFNSSHFVSGEWSTLEIPITLTNKNNIGLIIYENINGSPLTNFYLDNIYFHN